MWWPFLATIVRVRGFGFGLGSSIAFRVVRSYYTSRNAADDLFDEASCNGYTFDDDGDTTRNSNNRGVNSSNNSAEDVWDDLGAGHTPRSEPLLDTALRRGSTPGRAPFVPPRADQDTSWR